MKLSNTSWNNAGLLRKSGVSFKFQQQQQNHNQLHPFPQPIQQKHWTAPSSQSHRSDTIKQYYIQLVIRIINQYRFSMKQKQEITTNNSSSILTIINTMS
ncbi:unnamed protein product [Ambrosiozyma monospora]|uniref:Unnamed protein product n=1 Tax=Ambrosiozyma monospora TaxID=43982 RepID=A0A9W7DG58_AMBMO|nr:unnamed protein product [Ambrosiozyma monospora]